MIVVAANAKEAVVSTDSLNKKSSMTPDEFLDLLQFACAEVNSQTEAIWADDTQQGRRRERALYRRLCQFHHEITTVVREQIKARTATTTTHA